MDSWKPMGSWVHDSVCLVFNGYFFTTTCAGVQNSHWFPVRFHIPIIRIPCLRVMTIRNIRSLGPGTHEELLQLNVGSDNLTWFCTFSIENFPKMANWLAGYHGFHKVPYIGANSGSDVCVFATWAAFQNPCIFWVRYKYLYFARLGKGSFQRILGYLGSKPPQPRKYV